MKREVRCCRKEDVLDEIGHWTLDNLDYIGIVSLNIALDKILDSTIYYILHALRNSISDTSHSTSVILVLLAGERHKSALEIRGSTSSSRTPTLQIYNDLARLPTHSFTAAEVQFQARAAPVGYSYFSSTFPSPCTHTSTHMRIIDISFQ